MRLNVVYSSDENYARHVGVSIISLFENNKEFDEIYVYLIDNNISEQSKVLLKNISINYKRKLKFIPFKDLCENLNTDNSYSLSSYARLFLGKLTELEKVIYLDCDSIIEDSFVNLWNLNIDNYYVAGVQDTVNEFYKTSIGLDKNFRYINAGFLLINLVQWRKNNLENQFLKFIDKYKGSVPHHDQGTLNAICKEHILILEPKYNVQCPMYQFTCKEILKMDNISRYYFQDEIDYAKHNPCFIHFTNGFYNRPWNKKCTHPMKDLYLSYLQKSPWKDKILDGELCRNSKIMKNIYNLTPFSLYCFIHKFISRQKTNKLNRNVALK